MKKFDKHIKDDAPILFGLKKTENSPFVPNGYFEELPNQLLKIATKKTSKVVYLKKWLIYSASIAALIAFAFLSFEEFNHQKEILAFNNSFNELTAESFENEFLETENELELLIDFNDNK